MIDTITTGIVGGGKMGTSLFSYLSQFRHKLVWVVRSGYDEKNTKYQRKLKRALKNGIISEEDFNFKSKNQTITNKLEYLNKASVIIECIDEHIESKQELIDRLFKIIPKNSVIASNSSSIIPEKLGKTNEERRRIIGLHFFFPLEYKETVEIVESEYNSKETIEFTKAFVKDIKKQGFVQNGETRFLLNRVMLDWQACAFNYAKENDLSFKIIDEAVEKHLHAAAIFKTMDHIGLDIINYSAKNYQPLFKAENQELLLKFLNNAVENNRLGVKTQSGFYPCTEQELDNELQCIASELSLKFKSILNEWVNKTGLSLNSLENYMSEYFDTEIQAWIK